MTRKPPELREIADTVMKHLRDLTPAEKDRLIANHLEPLSTARFCRNNTEKRFWNAKSGLEYTPTHKTEGRFKPRSFIEPEMTVMLMKTLLRRRWIVSGDGVYNPETCEMGCGGVAVEHQESNAGDSTNVYRKDGNLEEAVRDTYLLAFGLAKV